jgi:hypothetical protein
MLRKKVEKPRLNYYPVWAPRFWHGMLISGWMRLIGPRILHIHPLRVPMACIVTGCTVLNSMLHFTQQVLYGRAVANTPLDKPPVFILGHWRSGTTFLHELLVRDERFAYPTTYECFAPNHFLLTGRLFPPLLGILLPAKRPTDNMAVSFDHPQEDEFALVAMGSPTPMRRLAFPNDPPFDTELINMEGVAEEDLARWKEAIQQFVRLQTYKKQKPVVLKSPPHTGRIGYLAELFPGAKFIHITRDPFSVFPSTRRLWQALEEVQGLQLARYENLDEFVFSAFEKMYDGFERQRLQIKDTQIYDVRYEDLVQDPVGQVQNIYEQLDLGDFEPVREKIEAYVGERKGYKTTPHDLEPAIRDEIRRRWGAYIEKYGYAEVESR